ncbi:MAG: sigma-70 family RNA polymerase sigma factor [Calditrichia bacterium]|nr:sigma-70 family RNA polymerase sigma factor [Calditrichia bacterium]
MSLFRKNIQKESDEVLMKNIRQGNKAAFEVLYDRYSKRLLYYFYRMLNGDQDKSQDFLQDLFLKIIEKPELFDESKKFSTWIYTVASNQCKNEYRRLKVRRQFNQGEEIVETIPETAQGPEERLDSRMFLSALEKELSKLEPEQRLVFILRFQENLPVKEIAEVTGLKAGTVKSKLFYITRKLADNLQDLNPINNEVRENVQVN